MMTYGEEFKITEEEKDFIVEFMAEMFKDHVTTHAKEMSMDILKHVLDTEYRSGNVVTLKFVCTQSMEDILKILVGFRHAQKVLKE